MIPWIAMLMNKYRQQDILAVNHPDIPHEPITGLGSIPDCSHHVIVLVEDINAMTVKALRYARSLTPRVTAFHIEVRAGEAVKLKQKWDLINTKIPLVVKPSLGRNVNYLLADYIDSEEYPSRPGDTITVLLPQLVISPRWKMALHNNTDLILSKTVLEKDNINVSAVPFFVDEFEQQIPSKK